MYSLLTSMQTGIAHLDAEHHDLVNAINRILNAEEAGDTVAVVSSLNAFRNELAGHFASEEHYLRINHFPNCDRHIQHHTEVVASLDHLREEVGRRTGIAASCFVDLLTAVVKMDMEFLNWLAERRYRACHA